MENILTVMMNLDQNVLFVFQQYGIWVYALLFAIIFCDAGLIFIPILPSDSLLFVTGAIAALHSLDIYPLFIIYFSAAILGDVLNYAIGDRIGRKVFVRFARWFNFDIDAPLKRMEHFFSAYGTKAATLGRVVPWLRAVIPFSAGIGKMNVKVFFLYDSLGAFLWTLFFLGAGYFIGDLPGVQDYLYIFLALIVFFFMALSFGTLIKGKKSRKSECS